MKHFVAIVGNTGVGKSTLTQLLAKKLGWEPFVEVVDNNPYLTKFYHDMPRWAFHSQMFFLSFRLQQHNSIIQRTGPAIQDGSIYEDAEIYGLSLYKQGHLTEEEWQVYKGIYRTLVSILQPPDLIIYLKASVPALLNRISQRDRGNELTIPEEYWVNLNKFCDEWISNFTLCPTLIINTDELDYIEYEEHLDLIAQQIHEKLQQNKLDPKITAVQTSHKTSMSFWMQKIKEVSEENDDFVRNLLAEESSKIDRLSEMSSSFGLPIYETVNFLLPNEAKTCLAFCGKSIKNDWKLNLRISDLRGQLIFRHLDIDNDSLNLTLERLKHLDKLVVRVSPYKNPSVSGTLWVSRGKAHLELVFGPHEWLTKITPQKNPIFRCSYDYLSVTYSIDDMKTRRILYRCLRDVVRVVLGVNIRQLSETQQSAYAEFHWHPLLGYRFLECSFSPAWTGEYTLN